MSVVRICGLAGVTGFLCACAPEAASFDSREPGARLEASFLAVEHNDRTSVHDLIRMLPSDDPAERLVAIRSLERLTGQTLGYDHAAPEQDRQAAIERWVAWDKSRPGNSSQSGAQGKAEVAPAKAR